MSVATPKDGYLLWATDGLFTDLTPNPPIGETFFRCRFGLPFRYQSLGLVITGPAAPPRDRFADAKSP